MKLSYSNFFSRLTQRERKLIGTLVGILFLIIGMSCYFIFQATIGSLTDEVADYREKLKSIGDYTPSYIEYRKKKEQVENAIKDNKISSLRIALNDLAKTVSLSDEKSDKEGAEESVLQPKLSDIISFEGKTQETLVERTAKKGKKIKKQKGDENSVIEIEQKMEIKEAPLTSLFDFYEKIEKSKELLYVTKMEISRKFNNFENARAIISVVTYRYQVQSPEPVKSGAQGL
jgi:hypothetical protein